MKKGNSIADAILIDALDTSAGITEEHKYIDQLCKNLNTGIKNIDQKIIIENGRQYDVFNLTMDDGKKRVLCFDITAFFGKI
jgi:hypothetical protein